MGRWKTGCQRGSIAIKAGKSFAHDLPTEAENVSRFVGKFTKFSFCGIPQHPPCKNHSDVCAARRLQLEIHAANMRCGPAVVTSPTRSASGREIPLPQIDLGFSRIVDWPRDRGELKCARSVQFAASMFDRALFGASNCPHPLEGAALSSQKLMLPGHVMSPQRFRQIHFSRPICRRGLG